MERLAFNRRKLLRSLTWAALGGAPLLATRSRHAGAAASKPGGGARRAIFFYFPDGVPAISQSGAPSLWHATGSRTNFQLSDIHASLAPFKDQCVFLNGLTMGPTDSGSHPGGAQKLLTAMDHGDGQSIDQLLARFSGLPRLYLGAMATEGISYAAAGTAADIPENNPLNAFNRLFPGGRVQPPAPAPMAAMPVNTDPDGPGIIDAVLADLNDLSGSWGSVEKTKLDLHLSALRDLEKSVKAIPKMIGQPGSQPPQTSCQAPTLDAYDPGGLNTPSNFPAILRAQTDLMVQAMACGLTHVGVLQSSVHTSELNMASFANTPMFINNYFLGSHKASHYGATHNEAEQLFHAFHQQVTWWVEQFAYLLTALKNRPEGDGNMLDYSLVVICTEISDGNTHSHDNMPFILAGGGGGAIQTGQLLNFTQQPHAGLYAGMAQAMGMTTTFGQANAGPLPGLLA